MLSRDSMRTASCFFLSKNWFGNVDPPANTNKALGDCVKFGLIDMNYKREKYNLFSVKGGSYVHISFCKNLVCSNAEILFAM